MQDVGSEFLNDRHTIMTTKRSPPPLCGSINPAITGVLLASIILLAVICCVHFSAGKWVIRRVNRRETFGDYDSRYDGMLPRRYHATGVISLPFDGINEPFEAWFAGDKHMSRIDYYHGMDKTIQRGDVGEHGILFKIVPMHSEVKPSDNNYVSCWYKPLPKWHSRNGQTVVPTNLTQFNMSGVETHRGHLSFKLQRKFTQYNKTNRYILYITAHVPHRPLRFEMIGYDDMLTSHYDHYVIDYMTFEPWKFNTTVFDVPGESLCRKKARINSTYVMNPMAEFMHFNHAKDKEIEKSYEKYKRIHKKKYETPKEHERRKHIYKHNMRFINSKNRQNLKYKLKSNHLADMSVDEIHVQNGLVHDHSKHYSVKHMDVNISRALAKVPDSLDWRDYGAVSRVHSQGICGSCWTFSALGAVEGSVFLRTGKLVELSKQQLLDCTWPVGNHGCRGGFQDRTLRWIKRNGVATKKDYGQYLAQEGYCHCGKGNCTSVHIDGFMHVKKYNPLLLKVALVTHGPIASSVNADRKTLRFYSHGIYDDKECGRKTNHAVLTIGFGTEKGVSYWLIKNSWGYLWGDNGYIKISTKHDICGTTSGSLIAIKKAKKMDEFPLDHLEKIPQARDHVYTKEETEPIPFK